MLIAKTRKAANGGPPEVKLIKVTAAAAKQKPTDGHCHIYRFYCPLLR
jgi:hypothetical protein